MTSESLALALQDIAADVVRLEGNLDNLAADVTVNALLELATAVQGKALRANLTIAPDVAIPVYIAMTRVFGSKADGWGCVVETYPGPNKPTAGTGRFLRAYNGPNAAYVAGEPGHISAFMALKNQLLADASYADIEEVSP